MIILLYFSIQAHLQFGNNFGRSFEKHLQGFNGTISGSLPSKHAFFFE